MVASWLVDFPPDRAVEVQAWPRWGLQALGFQISSVTLLLGLCPVIVGNGL